MKAPDDKRPKKRLRFWPVTEAGHFLVPWLYEVGTVFQAAG